jgi:CheY-like chemotaxis protein
LEENQSVLLIDDEALVLRSAASILRSAGYLVHTCTCWPDVIRTIHNTKPSLILVDYNMPGLKGDDICSVLKRNLQDRQFKVAIFSSEDEDKLARIVQECGADGYLSKTRGRAHIVEGVSTLLS